MNIKSSFELSVGKGDVIESSMQKETNSVI